MLHKNTIVLATAGIVIGALSLTAAIRSERSGEDEVAATSVAVDMFLKIEGVEGEATRRGHEGWIEIQAFNWGVSSAASAVTGASRAAGAPNFDDVSVTKYVDKATPPLAQACAEGKRMAEAEIVFYRAGSTVPAGSIKLWDVAIASALSTSEATADRPIEELSLTFGKIQWSYSEVDATGRARGTVTAGWDLTTNRRM